MAIQPFATQIQAPQIQTPNPINQMGQLMALRDSQQQNQLRGMQMGQLQREEADVNTLRGFDPNSPDYIQNITRINPKLGIELQTKQREADKFALETKVKGQELITARLTAFQERLKQALTPADRLAAHRAIHADRELGPYLASMGSTAESGEAQIIEAARSPETWNAFVVASNGGLEKLLEYNAKQADELRKQSGEKRAVAGEERAVTAAGQATAKADREATAANLGTYNPDARGFISSVTGKFTPLTTVQESKDARAAVKALATIGYDPVTANDKVTDLIKSSTGTLTGTWVDALVREFSGSTKGSRSIETLAAISNQLTLDLLDGKLGVGVATADVTFLQRALGDIANPNKPRGDRLAAWDQVVERFKTIAKVEKPKDKPGAPAAAPAGGGFNFDEADAILRGN